MLSVTTIGCIQRGRSGLRRGFAKRAAKHTIRITSYAAGVPSQLRVIYFSALSAMELTVLGLEPKVNYDAYFIVPSNGKRRPVGTVRGNQEGVWSMTRTRKHDLVLVMVAT